MLRNGQFHSKSRNLLTENTLDLSCSSNILSVFDIENEDVLNEIGSLDGNIDSCSVHRVGHSKSNGYKSMEDDQLYSFCSFNMYSVLDVEDVDFVSVSDPIDCNLDNNLVKSSLSVNTFGSHVKDREENFYDEESMDCVDLKSISNVISDESNHLFSLKGVALNTAGLEDKLRYGILDQYLISKDIAIIVESNTDHPCLQLYAVQDFLCIVKSKKPEITTYRYGGVHGICALFNPRLLDICDEIIEISDTSSECVLWILIKMKCGFHFILGATYIPCDRKDFKFNVFDDIEEDVLELRVKFNLPMFLAGDFNAHTQDSIDILPIDDVVFSETGCEVLDGDLSDERLGLSIPSHCTLYRYSQDKMDVNKNGNNLLSFCKSLRFKIANGRVGCDKFFGGSTCFKSSESSVIDYLVASDDMLSYISDFKVGTFDPCMSDFHAPIEFTISGFGLVDSDIPVSNDSLNKQEYDFASDSYKENASYRFQWSKESAENFKIKLENIDIETLHLKLKEVALSPNQDDINSICNELNAGLLETAKNAGVFVKRRKKQNSNNRNKSKKNDPPWFNPELIKKRKEYYRVKNKLKRKGFKKLSHQKAKEFKKLVKQQEKMYYKNLNDKIRKLKSSNSKEYWDLLNKSIDGKKARVKFCLETFTEHFRSINKAKENGRVFESNQGDACNEELNAFFDTSFVRSVIKSLKNNKAAGIDFIHNEFLKYSNDKLVAFYCDFFNVILCSSFVPEIWCEGIIMPLYKNKGAKNDPDNYRGITLLSCLGKLFTACLSKRISDYIHKNQMGIEQAGFRKDFSTLDHIFTLHAIINYYRNKKGRIYCAFIDYRKAFDFIDRSSLWFKLLQNNVNGRVLAVIKNMYEQAKSCVKESDRLSDFFSCNQGVRQGENLSPILFAIYLNDFGDYLSKGTVGLFDLDGAINDDEELGVFVRLYTLLYADDTVIMAESEDDLQDALNRLHSYCEEWSLNINLDKTKIVIFSRGIVSKHRDFTFNGSLVKVVSDYVYLGVVFNCNGSFKKAISKQLGQAKKAMFSLLEKAKILKLPFDIICELYETCIIPVLLYGSEIWGYEDLNDLEIFHRRFYKMLLGAYKFTPNCMVHGETGTIDIKTKVTIRMVNFWSSLVSSNNVKFSSILCNFVSKEYDLCSSSTSVECSLPNNQYFKWFHKIQLSLNEQGFSYLWKNKCPSSSFKSEFKQKCIDVFKQNWHSEVNSNSQCTVYKIFKEVPKIEDFMFKLENVHRFRLSKFIIRVHHLPVTNNRFCPKKLERDPCTFCPLCNTNQIGDESHYLFDCSFFNRDRIRFLPSNLTSCNSHKLAWEKIFKMDSSQLINVSKFIKIIWDQFKYKKPDKNFKLQAITRAGRRVKAVNRLNL